jgi:hypothetical protein
MRQIISCLPDIEGHYRYLLAVRLTAQPGPHLAAILKNPSTASATRSDPTIGKVGAWARRNGFASVAVINLFALRATHPAALNHFSYDEMIGPDSDAHIQAVVATADVVAAGWGDPNGLDPVRYDRRIAEVLRLLDGRPRLVGPLTQHGYPRHGLLWNTDCILHDWQSVPTR